MNARKQSLNLFNVSNEEVKRSVDVFFRDFQDMNMNEGDLNDDRKRILDLQMKLQSKDTLIESYSTEIDRLQKE